MPPANGFPLGLATMHVEKVHRGRIDPIQGLPTTGSIPHRPPARTVRSLRRPRASRCPTRPGPRGRPIRGGARKSVCNNTSSSTSVQFRATSSRWRAATDWNWRPGYCGPAMAGLPTSDFARRLRRHFPPSTEMSGNRRRRGGLSASLAQATDARMNGFGKHRQQQRSRTSA